MTENENISTTNTELETSKRTCLQKICSFKSSKLGIIIISAIILLLVAGAGAYRYFIMRVSNNVISYIPSNFDQVFYMKLDDDFKSLLNKVNTGNTNKEVFDVIKTVDEVGAFEYASGSTKVSFMVAKVTKDFDLKKASDAGLINSGNNYEFKKIKDNLYVYGDKSSVDYAINYKGDKIANDEKLKSKIDSIVAGKYNFAMFTKANNSALSDESTLSQYLQKLKYGTLLAHVGDKRSFGELGIAFNQKIEFGKDYSFKSVLGDYLNSSSIIYTEIGNLLTFLGTNTQQVSYGLSAIMANIPNAGTVMTSSDFDKIANTLNGNTAISLTNSNNIAGVGLALVFEKADAFEVLNKLFPYFKLAVDEQIKATNMTGVNVSYVEEANKIGANVTYPFVGNIPVKINVLLEKKGENLLLQIMDPDVTSSKAVTLKSTSKTVLNFFIDSGKIVDLYNKLAMLNPSAQALPNMDLFRDKKVYGTLDFDGDNLLLKYDTQN